MRASWTEFLNAPNAITVVRVAAAAPIILLLQDGCRNCLYAAIGVMILCELSDLFDGMVARRFALVSALGKILDPLADSLYRMAVFIGFAVNGWMPLWMLCVFLFRDLAVSRLRVVAELGIGTLAARSSGKWKAVAQGVAQFMVVGGYAIWGAALPTEVALTMSVALYAAALVTAYSLFDYASGVMRPARS